MIPPTSQNPPEFDELLLIYNLMQPKTVLEIGTHEGGTLYYWLKYAQPGAIVGSIDVQRIQPERYESWRRDDSVRIYWTTQKSQSVGARDWAKIVVGELDWLFIDGGHAYEEVKQDFELYAPLMNKRGVIAFHDILSYPPYNSEVSKYWDEIKNNYNYQEIIHPHTEWEKGPGIGVIYL